MPLSVLPVAAWCGRVLGHAWQVDEAVAAAPGAGPPAARTVVHLYVDSFAYQAVASSWGWPGFLSSPGLLRGALLSGVYCLEGRGRLSPRLGPADGPAPAGPRPEPGPAEADLGQLDGPQAQLLFLVRDLKYPTLEHISGVVFSRLRRGTARAGGRPGPGAAFSSVRILCCLRSSHHSYQTAGRAPAGSPGPGADRPGPPQEQNLLRFRDVARVLAASIARDLDPGAALPSVTVEHWPLCVSAIGMRAPPPGAAAMAAMAAAAAAAAAAPAPGWLFHLPLLADVGPELLLRLCPQADRPLASEIALRAGLAVFDWFRSAAAFGRAAATPGQPAPPAASIGAIHGLGDLAGRQAALVLSLLRDGVPLPTASSVAEDPALLGRLRDSAPAPGHSPGAVTVLVVDRSADWSPVFGPDPSLISRALASVSSMAGLEPVAGPSPDAEDPAAEGPQVLAFLQPGHFPLSVPVLRPGGVAPGGAPARLDAAPPRAALFTGLSVADCLVDLPGPGSSVSLCVWGVLSGLSVGVLSPPGARV
ncbi:hypothetical protein H696_02679 [Fonticula alba]|uniref:Uncharacterized protein n=1 Tax=Fonticula alba TaxID=691883 RepID=A0A058Z9Y8_FONAL|nr:hypothetical protein H696_02679 [Fonticula alba]KCV70352.1 hypothetical protein H696_02679 [Fonticula alba]|eukprot:XP_009494868.1 hypothetical protein H696_02679 [Fonticula alba]